MAVLARRKDTRQSIERARAAKAETAAKIAKLVDIRREALLTDESSDAEIVKLDREIATLKEAERVQGDRVAALEAQAAHEAAELRAHERQELIKRVEAKLAERDKIGA